MIQALGNFLQEHSPAYVVLAGFTDPIGSSEYNLQLSRQRAEGVRHYLMTQFKIAQDRIVTLWLRWFQPNWNTDHIKAAGPRRTLRKPPARRKPSAPPGRSLLK